jgi:hypothetical protein
MEIKSALMLASASEEAGEINGDLRINTRAAAAKTSQTPVKTKYLQDEI